MKVLLFNGTLSSAQDTSEQITDYLKNHLEHLGFEVVVFGLRRTIFLSLILA
ncbi:hypothetical protein [Mesonia mobilis]|uniref:hypothetical protein n=1 Tax=Mesonia mobilis TaxID=369791 RepID=UPI0026EE1297|nr:hypothetical protein [Mesonia mobilis]